MLGELALAFYSLLGAVIAWLNGHIFAVPFILLYVLGFGYVGGQGLWDARFGLWRWLIGPTATPHPPAEQSRTRRGEALSAER